MEHDDDRARVGPNMDHDDSSALAPLPMITPELLARKHGQK